METKVQFLTGAAIKGKTPAWLTTVFRATIVLTTVASFWVNGTTLIKEDMKSEVILALKSVDMLVWLAGRGTGEVPKKKEDE